jgi:hypothetical protein
MATLTSVNTSQAGNVITAVYTFSLTTDEQAELFDCCDDCGVAANCCADKLPRTLHATIENPGGGTCGCADGEVVTLVYNGGTSKWEGTDTFGTCGMDITLKVYCEPVLPYRWFLEVDFSDTCATPGDTAWDPSSTCDPLNLIFLAIFVTGCCTGGNQQIRVTVTI